MPSNSLVSFKPRPYPNPLPYKFFVALFDNQRRSPVLVVVGICEDTPLTKISVSWKMRDAQSYLVLITKSRRPMHKDHQGRVQHTTDSQNVYFHISLHCWRCIFFYLSPLMLHHHKRFLHSLVPWLNWTFS